MDIIEFHRYETEALKPSRFEWWAARVEKILGHDLDGDQESDGYSLDVALDFFNAGISAQGYAKHVLRTKGVQS
jgi:hypothetical protein